MMWIAVTGVFIFLLIFRFIRNYRYARLVRIAVISVFLVQLALCFVNLTTARLSNNPSLYWDIFGDASVYVSNGFVISEYLAGKNAPQISQVESVKNLWLGNIPAYYVYQTTGMSYFNGLIFSSFNTGPFSIKVFNSLLHILTSVMILMFMRRRVNERVSLIAFFITLFSPSLLVWSASGLRDTIIIFLTFLFLILGGYLFEKNSIFTKILLLGLLILILFLLNTLRQIMTLVLMAVSVILFLFFGYRMLIAKTRLLKGALFVFLIFVCIPFAIYNRHRITDKIDNFFDPFIDYSRGGYFEAQHLVTPRYQVFPSRYYTNSWCYDKSDTLRFSEKVTSILKGLFHLFFSPTPKDLIKKSYILPFLLTGINLLLSPFLIIGFCWVMRNKPVDFLPFILFFIIFAVIASISTSNVGTIFRIRDVLMPIYFMLSSLGMAVLFKIGLEEG